MLGAANQRGDRRTPYRAVLALLAALALALIAAPPSHAEEGPYEPDDTMFNAAGPLAIGQSHLARVEMARARDFSYFYVTSTDAHVTLTVANLGGGDKPSDIDVTILDSIATPLAGSTFIGGGEARTVAADLEPGKYFIEVAADVGFGDTYELTPGGSAGAFGAFVEIAGHCAAARSATNAVQTKLGRATAKLQRTTARLRRSRYGTPMARASARAAHRKAQARVRVDRRALRQARESRRPWCFIAQ